MKNIILTINIGMSIRNILRSPLFKELLRYYNIYILSPYVDQEDFRKEFGYKNVFFVKDKTNKYLRKFKNCFLRLFLELNYWGFWLEEKPDTVKKYAERLKQEKGIVIYIIKMCLASFWNSFRKIKFILELSSFVFLSEKTIEKIIIENNINLVITVTHDDYRDIRVVYNSKKLSIPTITFVHSWDGLPSRGRFLIKPDLLLVWNEIMKQQGINFHNFDENKIKIIGIPQYDTYLNWELKSKNKFYMDFNINADKCNKVITYTCSAKRVFPDELEFIEELIELIEFDIFPNTILIIRLHPVERKDLYLKKLSGHTRIRFSIPDMSFAASYSAERIQDGRDEFINIMAHSDVIINLASTITIDATLFNTPVVCVAYNPIIKEDAWNYSANWYDSTHFRNIVKTGGIKLAYSKDELIEFVNCYIGNSLTDAKGRKRLVKQQCEFCDSKSSQRFVSSVREFFIKNNEYIH